jgi:pyruvate formate lyase activating enzyme
MEKILKETLSDMLFYKNSGGGVTISGGEPLLFHEYTVELAKRLQAEKCHVAVETSCFGKWEHLNELAGCVDLFLTDIKCMDSYQHKFFVGVPNELILDNMRKLVNQGAQVRIRVPVIPGFNDNKENFERMAEFLLSLDRPVEAVDLLPYHGFAESKYDQLDREYKYKGLPSMEQEEVIEFEQILKYKGLSTTIGGREGVTARK